MVKISPPQIAGSRSEILRRDIKTSHPLCGVEVQKFEYKFLEGWQSLVYRGGLENRCGVIPTGGSNPLPSVVSTYGEKALTRNGNGFSQNLEKKQRILVRLRPNQNLSKDSDFVR